MVKKPYSETEFLESLKGNAYKLSWQEVEQEKTSLQMGENNKEHGWGVLCNGLARNEYWENHTKRLISPIDGSEYARTHKYTHRYLKGA